MRARAKVIEHDDPRPPVRRIHIRFLHELTAWNMAKSGRVFQDMFLEGANVEEVDGPARCRCGAGYAYCAGNAHRLIFVEASGVEDDEVVAMLDPSVKIGRRDMRRAPSVFDQLSEGLARGIDVSEYRR